jgi:uncharacterized protein (TIGR02284 family)
MNPSNTVRILNDLIATSKDGAKGFAEAASDATDPELKDVLGQRSAACSNAAIELQSIVRSLGAAPENGGTTAGAVHRGWIKIKSGLSDSNIAVLEEAERGEDYARSTYERALQCDLPAPIHEAVQRQYEGTLRNYELIRDLRNDFRDLEENQDAYKKASVAEGDGPPDPDDDPKQAAANERKERQALEELRRGHIGNPERS